MISLLDKLIYYHIISLFVSTSLPYFFSPKKRIKCVFVCTNIVQTRNVDKIHFIFHFKHAFKFSFLF